MSDPLLVDELEDELLRDQFNLLLEAMEGWGAYEAPNEQIHQAVTDKPILARIVSERGKSLLSVAISHLNLESSHRVIRCLIQAYPSALLAAVVYIQVYMIASHPEHCVLLPWIASNYTWILDDERCQECPPVFGLLRMYILPSSCTATTIKEFFGAYPRAFTQQFYGGSNILHKIIDPTPYRHDIFDVDLFKWIVERCPSSVLFETNSDGNTPLCLACQILFSEDYESHSSEICKYLIQMCPASVQMTARNHYLPIHILRHKYDFRVVREVVVCLLREYLESYDVWSDDGPPRSFPFIQNIKTLLDEEKELKETAASLNDTTTSLTEVVACTNDQLMRSASTVFDSWSTSFINTTEEKLQNLNSSTSLV